MTEHERDCVDYGLPTFVRVHKAAQVHGLVFKSWKRNTVTDSSAAFFVVDGSQCLARILHFVKMTACLNLDCEERILCRVNWYHNTVAADIRDAGDVTYRMNVTSAHNLQSLYVNLSDLVPTPVAMLPGVLCCGKTADKVRRTLKRVLVGPFEAIRINRKRWR
jgi:hypothetical protein